MRTPEDRFRETMSSWWFYFPLSLEFLNFCSAFLIIEDNIDFTSCDRFYRELYIYICVCVCVCVCVCARVCVCGCVCISQHLHTSRMGNKEIF